ncbi:MAG: hypothetical protein ACTHJV_01795 [Rhizobiaceae bacterium]
MRPLLIAVSALAFSTGLAFAQTNSSAPAGTGTNSVAKSNSDMGQNTRGKGTHHRPAMKNTMMEKSTAKHHATRHHHHTKKTMRHSAKKTPSPKPSATKGG